MDKGLTWTASFEGIPGSVTYNAVTDLDFHRQNKDIVYASTSHKGIYISNKAQIWLSLGTPEYDVYAIATSSLYSATQGGLYQLTGPGVIAGKVTDEYSHQNIDGATVFTDVGSSSITVDGDYIMVVPGGVCSVTSIADGHANITEQNITVTGGNVTFLDISMQSGISDPSVGPGQNIDRTSGGGGYCFIATAAYGSPLAKQVDLLRRFRDVYLLPYHLGRDMVNFYYRTGKPIAVYIESHSWLKPPVRLVLYPLVGLAWLLLSTSILTKGIIALCILIACVVLFKQKMATAKRLAAILLFLIFISFNNDLHAATLFQQVGVSSSPNPVGSGARAVGMGGAFIAVADDATAASWNPAGLIQLEKPELSAVGAYFRKSESFVSDVHHEIDNTGKSDDYNLNYLSATYPFKLYRNMAVSINYQRLYDFKRSFNHRFNLSSSGLDLLQDKNFDQNGSVGALGLAYAVQITPVLSLGATLNIWTDQLSWRNGWDETFSEHDTGTQGGVPVTIDTRITDNYSRFRGINANLGLLWNINNHLTIGAVVKTPFDASLRHEFRYKSRSTFGTPVDTQTSSQSSLIEDVKLHMPLSYGLGVAWRVSDALSFALDIYRTEWSQYVLTDAQGNEFSPIDGRPKSDSDAKDTTQVRLGGEYLFIGTKTVIPVRGGLFYDPEPSHGAVKDFYGATIGTGIGYQNMFFDMAYQLRWGRNIDTGNLINTSKADIDQHLFLASVIVHFK
ncbi:MAG: outer membrane protein transport protein [Nitrospirae bacterium]|nr:outer membrane protein transport protein [Nitrospirota bacterium]